MRFVTFDDGLDELVGVLSEDRVIPLSDDAGDLLDLIVAGDTALDFTRAKLAVSRDRGQPLANVRLLAPLRRFGRDILCTRWNGDQAEFFTRRADTVLGPYDVAYDPTVSAELAVVLGRPGRDLPRAAALDHVWGYTLSYNNLDAMAIGPWVVTPDEFGDPPDLVATLISELSSGMALRPGDLLLTGTPAGADAVSYRGLATPATGDRP